VDAAGEEAIFDDNPAGFLGATNNEMELMAAIEALRRVTGSLCPTPREAYGKIVVYADAEYVVANVHAAEHIWPGTNWITSENEPVLSPDLWQELVRLKRRAGRVEFRHVKAHKTNPHNKVVDDLAKESADLARRPMRAAPIVARKRGEGKTKPRSVPMQGQVETIRIITVREIRGQPHHVYKYEVLGEGANSGAIDDVFALDDVLTLRRSHIYEVRFAEPGRGRWIEEVIAEIERENAAPQD